MPTLKYTDALLNDGVQNDYFAYDAADFRAVTTPIAFGYSVFPTKTYFATPPDDLFYTGDRFYASKLILTNQDDHFEVGLNLPVTAVWGADGNDTLVSDDVLKGVTFYGGSGDDLLITHFSRPDDDRNHLLGGDGNDLLLAGGTDEMTGGAGTDHFVVSITGSPGGRGAFITDLAVGTESVDMYRLFGGYLTFTDALDAGAAMVDHRNGYIAVYLNTGDQQSPFWQMVTYIKGTMLPSQYDSTFTTNFANSYFNRPETYDKILDGTANPARDHLVGGLGRDVLIMGDTDEATAHGGGDRFVLTNLTGASAFITDITNQIGNNLQVNMVDLTRPLYEAGYSYHSFSEARAAGTLDVRTERGYTYLYFDADGDHVAEHEFAHIKGVPSPDFPIDNLYLVAPSQSYFDLTAMV
ncbi:MAG TPA: hypothetical protein VHM27_12460 [Rhizomicrobium sp.]|jgi:hypothetical protein|nr:hypothetical protein [Rhizomicrobium sp.]